MICAGASLASVFSSAFVSVFAKLLPLASFILLSMLCLFLALIFKSLLIKEAENFIAKKSLKAKFKAKFQHSIGTKSLVEAFRLIVRSKYLLLILSFIMLLSAMSTFLYMQQGRIVAELFPKELENAASLRAAAFANIDFIVQSASLILQIFFTARLAKLGLKWLLCLAPLLICPLFVLLLFTNPAFWAIALAMSVRRIGEYALIKPAREMLFVPLSEAEKYKVKNFFDMVAYRGADMLFAWLEAGLLRLGLGAMLLGGAFLSLLCAFTGFRLAQRYKHREFG